MSWQIRHSLWRRRLAALGCILIGLPWLLLSSPVLAEPQAGRLHLRIDLSDRSDWRVDWWQEGDALPRAGEWQVEPFLHEGLARLHRLWPEGPRHAGLNPRQQPALQIDDADRGTQASGPRGSFRLRPVMAGQGLDQSFAFPAQVARHLQVEITGLTPATALEFSGLELAEAPVIGGTIRLQGQFAAATPVTQGFGSPLRFTLSSHGDHAALGRAILAPFKVSAIPSLAPAETPPNRATLLSLMRALDTDAAGGFEPQLARSIAEAGPLRFDGDRTPGPLDRALALAREMTRRGWESRLVFVNRRHVPGLPLFPAFLFDTVLVEAPQADLLIDPVNGLLMDAEAPHIELGGKAALVIADGITRLRNFRPLRPIDNHLIIRAQVSLDHSGVSEGQSLTEAYGAARPLLAQLLQRLREQPGHPQELLEKQGMTGRIQLGYLQEEEDRLGQHVSFQFVRSSGPGSAASVQATIGPRLFRPPFVTLMPVLRERMEAPVACHPLRLEHQLVLHLPDVRSLLDVPPDLRIDGRNGFYEARYRVEPGHLHVERLLEFDPPGPLCSADFVREMAPVLRAAGRDLDRVLNVRRSP